MTDGEVLACPDCDNSNLRKDRAAVDTMYCQDCQAYIEPTRRPPKTHANAQNGLARKLLNTDADEVGGGA